MPFSHDQFLDAFAAYNAACWPAIPILWIATAVAAVRWVRSPGISARALYTLLAVHWGWSGAVYHWRFFRPINPAAAAFAVVFLLQACVFLWLAITASGKIAAGSGARRVISVVFVAYGLLYPLLGLLFGLHVPRMPLFAVPCPTTLVTTGWLVSTSARSRLTHPIPIIWALIATSAAVTLGIRADLMLAPAAIVLMIDIVEPGALGVRAGTLRPGRLL